MEAERLRGLGPFGGLDDPSRSRLADQLAVREVPAGTDLLAEGQPVPGLAVLLRGTASVWRVVDGRSRELAVLGHGAFVGELSLLDPGATATATVTAVDDLAVVGPVDGDGSWLLDDPVVGPPIRAAAERRLATNRVTRLGPVRVPLPGGTEVDLRPLWPDDWRLMDEGRHRTSQRSLYQRFLAVPKLTEPLLRRLATVDFVDDFAWVGLAPGGTADASGHLLGVGRYARLPDDHRAAEVALLVGDDRQRTGLGTRLLVALAVAARHHGIEQFEAVALSSNRGIRRLLSSAGAEWRTDPDDPAHVVARWPVGEVLDHLGETTDVAALHRLVRHALPAG